MFQIRNETTDLAKGAAKAMFDFYEVVTHELLSHDLRYITRFISSHKSQQPSQTKYLIISLLCIREQLDTWNILARARNEGRLFSRIEWPRDPEIVSSYIRNKKEIYSKYWFCRLTQIILC